MEVRAPARRLGYTLPASDCSPPPRRHTWQGSECHAYLLIPTDLGSLLIRRLKHTAVSTLDTAHSHSTQTRDITQGLLYGIRSCLSERAFCLKHRSGHCWATATALIYGYDLLYTVVANKHFYNTLLLSICGGSGFGCSISCCATQQNGYGFIYSSMPYEVHIYCNVRRPSPDGGRVHAGERELEY